MYMPDLCFSINSLRSELFERFHGRGSEFLAKIGKTFISHISTKEISQLAAHLHGKEPLYFKTSLSLWRILQKAKKSTKNLSVFGTSENKARGTSLDYTLHMPIKNQLVKPLYLHLHKCQKNFWA